MRFGACIASVVAFLALGSCGAFGQASSPSAYEGGGGDDNPRANVHLGAPMAIPLNPTARAVHLGFGLVVGAGYNFSRRHAAVGEFMWNNLFPTNEALAKVRTATSNPKVNASARVMALTGNYRFELRGKTLGAYFLGGGGLYYRKTSLSQEVTTGTNTECTPLWLWWGFTCGSGTVTANQTLSSWSSSSGGVNGGIGFTARVGDAPHRLFVESRYHYAPNTKVNLQLIEISFGIRY
jgi:Outer membrane protein beta-barrel domain